MEIEVTQEMVDAFYDQLAGGFATQEEVRAGLTAALALAKPTFIITDEVEEAGHRATEGVAHGRVRARIAAAALAAGFRVVERR